MSPEPEPPIVVDSVGFFSRPITFGSSRGGVFGALSLAGLKAYVRRERIAGESLVAIESGANMNFDRLRHVADDASAAGSRTYVFWNPPRIKRRAWRGRRAGGSRCSGAREPRHARGRVMSYEMIALTMFASMMLMLS